jgi:hypothetical protein
MDLDSLNPEHFYCINPFLTMMAPKKNNTGGKNQPKSPHPFRVLQGGLSHTPFKPHTDVPRTMASAHEIQAAKERIRAEQRERARKTLMDAFMKGNATHAELRAEGFSPNEIAELERRSIFPPKKKQ